MIRKQYFGVVSFLRRKRSILYAFHYSCSSTNTLVIPDLNYIDEMRIWQFAFGFPFAMNDVSKMHMFPLSQQDPHRAVAKSIALSRNQWFRSDLVLFLGRWHIPKIQENFKVHWRTKISEGELLFQTTRRGSQEFRTGLWGFDEEVWSTTTAFTFIVSRRQRASCSVLRSVAQHVHMCQT